MRRFPAFIFLALLIFPAGLVCPRMEQRAFQGQALDLKLAVSGISRENLRGLSLSYHLYTGDGRLYRYENPRFSFRIKGNFLNTRIYFPAPAGYYTVEFELLKEGEFWGREKGWRPCRISLKLLSLSSRDFRRKFPGMYIPLKDPLLDSFQNLLRLTLENNRIMKDGRTFGFSPGSSYPQVWIRDLATTLDFASLHYSPSDLKAMVELFLKFQHQDGEVVDWISPDYRWDKNTVSSDQESSLVLAAYPLAMRDPSWLCKRIRGKRIIDRLNLALRWVWEKRRSRDFDLIWSGFKADWGDVSLEHPRDPVHFHPGDMRVVGIYTQAKYYQALMAVSRMNGICSPCVHFPVSKVARKIKENSLKYLYLEDMGYFLVHRVEGHPEYVRMEKRILAVGGNSEAILAGFMNRARAVRFFSVLERRMKVYGLNSPGFSLIPPYPQGFFKFHLMRPWHYQNGGDWDWIGARVIRAMIKAGLRKKAEKYLKRLAVRDMRDMCIYEWRDREGRGKGAMFYTGAAGEMGRALVDLTAGIKFDRIRRKNKE